MSRRWAWRAVLAGPVLVAAAAAWQVVLICLLGGFAWWDQVLWAGILAVWSGFVVWLQFCRRADRRLIASQRTLIDAQRATLQQVLELNDDLLQRGGPF